ncbi:hypothetical protein ABT052_02505 [Streptomyces sp. NPDC002766]|uniref:hypothetical protein n=1 Tax=Streptomyces sp. NPDC002766 TaxID=3154429 RepID=UPI0033243FE8
MTIKYLYFSERRLRQIAADNDIDLDGKRRWVLRSPTLPFTPQAEVGSKEGRTAGRHAMAKKIEKAIGEHADESFTAVPRVSYAKGRGKVSFARFVGTYATNNAVLLHAQTVDVAGKRVDVCMFGSEEHLRSFRTPAGYPEVGWVSSEAPAIEELLRNQGMDPESPWHEDADEDYLAVEALKVALYQGESLHHREHAGRPWTRDFTLGHAPECEWFAEIFADVILDPDRWDLRGEMEGWHRILIGAPMWARALRPEDVVRYSELRQDGRRLRRYLPGGRRRAAVPMPSSSEVQIEIIEEQPPAQ